MGVLIGSSLGDGVEMRGYMAEGEMELPIGARLGFQQGEVGRRRGQVTHPNRRFKDGGCELGAVPSCLRDLEMSWNNPRHLIGQALATASYRLKVTWCHSDFVSAALCHSPVLHAFCNRQNI